MKSLVLSVVLIGCSGAKTADNTVTAGSYEAQQQLCVDQAKTLEESHACRCAHPASNGHRPAFCDGGAP